MFCRKCGKSIPDDSVFCPYCGEAVTSTEPAEEEKEDGRANEALYGRCERCGKPLQADDGTLCAECAAKMINQYTHEEQPDADGSYPYGACGLCDGPLEPDDEFICKKCKAGQEERDRAIGVDRLEHDAKKFKHGKAGGAIVIILLLFCAIAMILYFYQNSGSPSVQTNAYPSSSESQGNNAVVSENMDSSSSEPSSTEPEKPDLELLSAQCSVDEYSTHVTGKVKNNTSKQLTYVQIQYALYDSGGNQIGTALANVNGLEAGGTWKFDAIGITGETKTCKLIALTGY